MEKRLTEEQLRKAYRDMVRLHDEWKELRHRVKSFGSSHLLKQCRVKKQNYIEAAARIAQLSKDEEYMSVFTYLRMEDAQRENY